MSEGRDHGKRKTLFKLDVDEEDRRREGWPSSTDFNEVTFSSCQPTFIFESDAMRPRSVRGGSACFDDEAGKADTGAALTLGKGSCTGDLVGTGGCSDSAETIEGNGFLAIVLTLFGGAGKFGVDNNSGVGKVEQNDGRAEAISVDILSTCSCSPAIFSSCLRMSSLFRST